MKEIEFNSMVKGLWGGFCSAAKMIDILEGIGLSIEAGKQEPGMHALYTIEDTMAKTVLKVLDIDDDHTLEAVDAYLLNLIDKESDPGSLSDEAYQGLLTVIREYSGRPMSWEIPDDRNIIDDRNVVKHKGMSLENGEIVKGYIWNGADHAYIIPERNGISYDDSRITAYAVEVDKKTIEPVFF